MASTESHLEASHHGPLRSPAPPDRTPAGGARGAAVPVGTPLLRKLAISGTALVFLLPSLFGLLVYNIGPVLYGLYISFTRYTGMGTPLWTGLRNYRFLLQDGILGQALLATGLLTVLIVPLTMGLALALALLLNEPLPLRPFLRLAFYLPSAVSWVATALLFKNMFDYNYGLVNQLLKFLHLPPQQWVGAADPQLLGPTFWLIVVVSIWKGYGFTMLIYLAALQDQPEEVYEAARIDGAQAWQRLWYVTLPALRPISFFVFVVTVIGGLQIFTPVFLLGGAASNPTGAGTGGGLQTVSVYAYVTAFQGNIYGYGSAILWALFVVMFGFTVAQFRISVRGTRRGEGGV